MTIARTQVEHRVDAISINIDRGNSTADRNCRIVRGEGALIGTFGAIIAGLERPMVIAHDHADADLTLEEERLFEGRALHEGDEA